MRWCEGRDNQGQGRGRRSGVVTERRTGLDQARASAAEVAAPEAKQTFLARMRKFLNV
jgi:hypothetical protein